MSTRALFHTADSGDRLAVLGTDVTIKVTADDTNGAYEVVVVDSGPGGDAVPHRHPWQEFYFLLEGRVDVQIGARSHQLEPGGIVTIPPRALHAFNVTSERARFLHVSAGRGATDMFRDFAAKVPHAPTLDDLGAVLEVGARYGIELAVPAELLAAGAV
jgi:quercetin dioxygenase-like cupin family protein